MQKPKLLLEPKQETNSDDEKKEKIKLQYLRNKIESKSSTKYKNFGKVET